MVSQTRGNADPSSVISTGFRLSDSSSECGSGILAGIGEMLGGRTTTELVSAVSVLIVIRLE